MDSLLGLLPENFGSKDFSENVSSFLAREVVGVFSLFLAGALSCKSLSYSGTAT